VNPWVELSPETLAALRESREQHEAGDTISLDETVDKYDVDVAVGDDSAPK